MDSIDENIEPNYTKANDGQAFFLLNSLSKDSYIGHLSDIVGQPNGNLIWYCSGSPGSTVSIRLERVPNTGGHFHGLSTNNVLAVGYIFPTNFVLHGDYPQNYVTTQILPNSCGTIRITITIGSSIIYRIVDVKIDGLVQILSSGGVKLKEAEKIHPSPYWGTPTFNLKLQQLADEYLKQRKKYLTVTDASLEWGGRFDLKQDWNKPHVEHRNGHQADVRKNDMNQGDIDALFKIATAVNINIEDHDDHWHIRG